MDSCWVDGTAIGSFKFSTSETDGAGAGLCVNSGGRTYRERDLLAGIYISPKFTIRQ